MAKSYPIREVILAHKELVEQMGTKPKFWAFESETDRRWLFKYIRPNTGEDWSEKIAAEVAQLLGIPHAYVELAACEEARGVLCLDFTENTTKGELVHGNELLAGIMPDYPKDQRFKVTQHTLGNMARCLEMNFIHLPDGCDLPQGISKPIDLFVGYLLLDALIGNTDRHHENWGILERRVRPEKPRYAEVAPSFDHASSLGQRTDGGQTGATSGK